ncbi:hypothetical protein DVH24_032475 [Malus domestica]|uniref:Uncharacterized protein n=1 Tax=Malus domestica TaxID=3750 RepID=A0A498J3F3_MALDO|nr:hypothetical protein DVH24_032475 [Malus domestica]
MKCSEFEHEMPRRPPGASFSAWEKRKCDFMYGGCICPSFERNSDRERRERVGLLSVGSKDEGNIGELIYSLILAISNDLVNPIILLLEQFKECFSRYFLSLLAPRVLVLWNQLVGFRRSDSMVISVVMKRGDGEGRWRGRMVGSEMAGEGDEGQYWNNKNQVRA